MTPLLVGTVGAGGLRRGKVMASQKRRWTRVGNRIGVWMYRRLDGRFSSGSKNVHVLMITTPGRRTGIPQSLPATKMAVVGDDWRSNPYTQIRWGLAYIAARYGNPQRAWQHSERLNWY